MEVRQVPYFAAHSTPSTQVWMVGELFLPDWRAATQVLPENDQTTHEQQGRLGAPDFSHPQTRTRVATRHS
jgi:hypothetical protein